MKSFFLRQLEGVLEKLRRHPSTPRLGRHADLPQVQPLALGSITRVLGHVVLDVKLACGRVRRNSAPGTGETSD